MDSSLTENPLDRAHDPKERAAALLRFGIFVGLAVLLGIALLLIAQEAGGKFQIPTRSPACAF